MSQEISLLDQLSKAAREEAQDEMLELDERWDRLTAGTLSENEKDELRGLADASGAAYEAYQAFAPLGKRFEQHLVASILTQQQNERLLREAAEPAAAAPPLPPPVPKGRGWLRWVGAAGAVLGAGLLLLHTGPVLPVLNHISLSAVTFATNRDSPAMSSTTLTQQQPFEIKVSFGGKADPDLQGKAFLLQDGHLAPVVGADLQLEEQKFVLKANRPPAELKPGPVELIFVAFGPGYLPTEQELLAAIGQADGSCSGNGWRCIRETFELALE